jgi:AraC family ethanolamine operon transcriptional activator
MNARPEFVEAPTFTYRKVITRDADEQAENLSEWDQTYDQLTPGRFSGSLTEVWFDDIQLFRETTNQSVHEAGSSWPGSRTFGVPLAMEGAACFAGRAMGEDMILTLGGDEELDFRTSQSLDLVGIAVDDCVLNRFWRSVEPVTGEGQLQGRSLIHGSATKMAELRAFLRSVFDVLEENADVLSHAPTRKSLQNAILGNLTAVLADAPDEPPANTAAQRRQVVEWAKAYALEHLDEAVTVAELCTRIGVSRRHLQYCFQDVLNTNPVQYLRAMRLNRVRRELKVGGSHASVQDVAARWGFWHLSHFASDYKKMFGELPSQTRYGCVS